MQKIYLVLALLIVILVISTGIYWVVELQEQEEYPKSSKKPSVEQKGSLSKTVVNTKQSDLSSRPTPTKLELSSPKPEPPPPDKYWSELTRQLLGLEQERADTVAVLMQKMPATPEQPIELPLPENSETMTENNVNQEQLQTSESFLTTPPTSLLMSENLDNISWASIGRQLILLEQQRQEIVFLLAEKMATSQGHSSPMELAE